jgi:Domain of unknown function (DUF4179)
MEKNKMIKHLDNAIEKQTPDVWDKLMLKIHNQEISNEQGVRSINVSQIRKRKSLYKRFSITVAACLLFLSILTFTPVLASIQKIYDEIFSSEHIDDTGLKSAIIQGQGQSLNQTYYDKKNDITVHFDTILMDDKETKLLFTYQSEKTNLKNYYIDLFEGGSKINLITSDNQKIPLDNVGWGSRYYDSKKNKVAEALSFDSVKEYEGQEITLEIIDLTIHNDKAKIYDPKSIHAKWPLSFKLDKNAISNRETVAINKEFNFEGETYKINSVEFSSLETRIVVTGTDTKLFTDENGMKYKVMSKLEKKLLNARRFDKKHGYTVNEKKSGVFLRSAGDKVAPIFSKGEVQGADDEYIMIFEPVSDQNNTILEIGNELKIPLTNQ